jgi:hypothetical protein
VKTACPSRATSAPRTELRFCVRGSGHLVTGLASDIDFEVRRFLFERFPYGVFDAHLQDEIVVVAVAHQHRRPGYWMRRLAKVTPRQDR